MCFHCVQPHLVNDDTDVMSLSSPLPLSSSKLSRGQSYQVAARETKERCSVCQWLEGCVCVCVCDAYTLLKAAAINCEGGGLASQPASIAPIRLDIGGAGPRSKSSRWVVTGDGLVQEVWLNLGRSCTICFYGGHLSNAALHNENKRTS